LARIHWNVLPALARLVDIQALFPQLLLKDFAVRLGSNHNERFPYFEALPDEMGDRIGEGRIVLVELEAVPELDRVVRSWVRQELRALFHRTVIVSHISINAFIQPYCVSGHQPAGSTTSTTSTARRFPKTERTERKENW
jgi:hypothetical protein